MLNGPSFEQWVGRYVFSDLIEKADEETGTKSFEARWFPGANQLTARGSFGMLKHHDGDSL